MRGRPAVYDFSKKAMDGVLPLKFWKNGQVENPMDGVFERLPDGPSFPRFAYDLSGLATAWARPINDARFRRSQVGFGKERVFRALQTFAENELDLFDQRFFI
jgi:hypothetical protein